MKTVSKRVSVVSTVVGPGCNLQLMWNSRQLQWPGKVEVESRTSVTFLGLSYTKPYFTQFAGVNKQMKM